ncbi:MAG: hypothetical protein H0U74_15815 [Bradymonadaceae bacterium]|nr:hypothetical protein [Lujinxingiaceae bacterium]
MNELRRARLSGVDLEPTYFTGVFMSSHMPTPRWILRSALIFALAPFSMAAVCGGATAGGENDQLSLKIVDDQFESAVTSTTLAEGTRVTMRAVSGLKDSLTLESAKSSSPGVLEVVSFQRDLVVLSAKSAGEAVIDVVAEGPESGNLRDSVNLSVRTPASLEITDSCRDEVYLTAGTIDLPYTMRDSSGKSLAGYGFYPLNFIPAGPGPSVDANITSVGLVRFRTGDKAGNFALNSDLSVNAMSLEIVEPDQVTVFNADSATGPDISLASGTAPVVTFLIKTATKSICGTSDHVQVTSLTPDTCIGSMGWFLGANYLRVTPKATGSCQLEVNLLGTDDAILHSDGFALEIAP